MNYSSAVMLINQNIRAVKIVYEKDSEHNKVQRYIFKTLDQSIQKGDLVVIPTSTRHGYTVVMIDEVNVDVDFDSSVELKWIVCKAPIQQYEAILSEEKKWIEAIKESEKLRRREEIKKNMFEMYKDSGIEQIGIATMQASSGGMIENKTETSSNDNTTEDITQ